MAFLSAAGLLYIHGGTVTPLDGTLDPRVLKHDPSHLTDELWIYNQTRLPPWQQVANVSTTWPEAVAGHTATVVPGNKVVVIGGRVRSTVFSRAFYILELSVSPRWHKLDVKGSRDLQVGALQVVLPEPLLDRHWARSRTTRPCTMPTMMPSSFSAVPVRAAPAMPGARRRCVPR